MENHINCPNCNIKMSVPSNQGLLTIGCPSCFVRFKYDSNANTINPSTSSRQTTPETEQKKNNIVVITCPKCNTKLRCTDPHGVIGVKCICGYLFDYDVEKSQHLGPSKIESNTKPQPVRTLTITRLNHKIKDLRNNYNDFKPVTIFIDLLPAGILSANGTLKIDLNEKVHSVRCGVLKEAGWIPAGTESLVGYYFENQLWIGYIKDDFAEQVGGAILNTFLSPGFKSLLTDPNNVNKSIKVQIEKKGIRLSRVVNNGGKILTDESLMTYSQLNITPRDKKTIPMGYWNFLNEVIHNATDQDVRTGLKRISLNEYTLDD